MAVRIILDTRDEHKLLEVLHAYAGQQQLKYNKIPFEEACSDEAVRYMRGRDWANALIRQVNTKTGRCDPEPHITKTGSWLNVCKPAGKGYYIAKCNQCNNINFYTVYCGSCGSKNLDVAPAVFINEEGNE